jgi:hypothetical protein
MASKRESERTVQVVAVMGVALVVGSAEVVAVREISAVVVRTTSMKLGPGVENASMDEWKHCFGPSDEIRGRFVIAVVTPM